MRLYTILKLIIQAITSIKTSLSGKVNNYYHTSGSVAAIMNGYFTVCTLTVSKPGMYLVLGQVCANVDARNTINIASLAYPDTTKAASIIEAYGRATMTGGGGVLVWGLAEVKAANAKINLRSYGYYQGSWMATGHMLAIRII